MSILLEALRKSERHRRAGEGPDIHSADMVPAESEEEGYGRLIWILLAAAFLALLWLAWRQYVAVESQAVESATAGAMQQAATQSVETPADNAGDAGSSSMSDAGDAALETGSRTPVESLAQAEPQATTSPPAEAGPAGPSNTQAAPAPTQPAADKPAARQPKSQASQPPQTSSRSQPPTPISYWELPQNLRDQLPEFRISVLVFDEEPADRFILMNGKRLKQLDDAAPGLRVIQIQRGRVIFNYRKYRFYVKQ